jgi:hypothetical protein
MDGWVEGGGAARQYYEAHRAAGGARLPHPSPAFASAAGEAFERCEAVALRSLELLLPEPAPEPPGAGVGGGAGGGGGVGPGAVRLEVGGGGGGGEAMPVAAIKAALCRGAGADGGTSRCFDWSLPNKGSVWSAREGTPPVAPAMACHLSQRSQHRCGADEALPVAPAGVINLAPLIESILSSAQTFTLNTPYNMPH